ncbi:hypothetical protein TNCT_499811, partial [Trichonephila clavata]
RESTVLFKTLIHPVLTYALETWIMTMKEEKISDASECKVLNSVLGGNQENGNWSRKRSTVLYRMFKEPDVVYSNKIRCLNWSGHIIHVNGDSNIL